MAKGFNKFLGFIGLEPDEEYDEQETMAQPDYSYTRQQANPQPVEFEERSSEPLRKRAFGRSNNQSKDGKVISMYKNNGGNNIIIFRPTSSDDAANMIDSLKSNRPVIANFENIDEHVAQRTLDIVSGGLYAMRGSIHQVSKSIFVFAPENMDVSGEGKDLSRKGNLGNLYMDLSR